MQAETNLTPVIHHFNGNTLKCIEQLCQLEGFMAIHIGQNITRIQEGLREESGKHDQVEKQSNDMQDIL